MKKIALQPMITKQEALNRLFSAWNPERKTETIPLREAVGRVLAEDQLAAYNIPVSRASEMDGIAVDAARFADGMPDTARWKPGQDYVRADTGDDFPDAFDAVVAIEDVTFLEGGGIRLAEGVCPLRGDNIRPCGADVRQGALLAPRGKQLTSRDLAVIGLGGSREIPVIRKPRAAFLPTGSELVPVGFPLRRGQNYDTNSLMVESMLLRMGAEPIMHPIVPDDPKLIRAAFETLLGQADIVLLNAGTSKGEEDYCAHLLGERGTLLFHGVAAVPGRPISMAVIDGKAVINLSGPAGAALHSMIWAIRPIVCYALGIPVPQTHKVRAVLAAPVKTESQLSRMTPMRLEQTKDGLTARPISLHAPKAELLTMDGYYLTQPGEQSPAAGSELEIELPD